jgi:hypothetical protein
MTAPGGLDKVHRAQADALEIEAGAKRRLADEYARIGDNLPSVPDGNSQPTAADLGLSRKGIHDAREIRDAEASIAGVLELVAAYHHIAVDELVAPTRRSPAIARARQVAMYLAVVDLEIPRNTVGRIFGRHWTTIGYAVARVEDRRDDPAFDGRIAELEAQLVPTT